MTKDERKQLTEIAIRQFRQTYWLNEFENDHRNLEQRHASYIEARFESDKIERLLHYFDNQIQQGLTEIGRNE